MYDNEIETKENKILTKGKMKPRHIRNHDFSDVITPSPFYLVAKPFLWGKGRAIGIVMGGGGIFEPKEFFGVIKFLVWIFFNRCAWIFFHLIFPYANIFFCTSPSPTP